MNNLVEKPQSIGQFLAEKKTQIEMALPKHMDAGRLLRITMTELTANPRLRECTKASLIGSLLQCAQLGLEPGDKRGLAYLIPYRNKKENTLECQLQIGYRGMIDLCYRSNKIGYIFTSCVYEKDEFEYQYGSNAGLKHKPVETADRGDFKGAYCIVTFSDGNKYIEFMPAYKIEAIKMTSIAKLPDWKKGSCPWAMHFDEMAAKTVLRHSFKWLPSSVDLQRAITLDEEGERGTQNNQRIIDGEVEHVSKSQTLADQITVVPVNNETKGDNNVDTY